MKDTIKRESGTQTQKRDLMIVIAEKLMSVLMIHCPIFTVLVGGRSDLPSL